MVAGDTTKDLLRLTWLEPELRMCSLLLTLIYPAHFEDVPCQSGVNHIL